MADALFDQYSADIFVSSTLNLVGDAMHFLREDNEELIPMRETMSPEMFAQEFRTIHVRCRRRLGHTNLINQLAYNLLSPIGRKYSTIVVTPKRSMADAMYGHRAAYFKPDDQYEAMQKYAAVYTNYMRSIQSHVHFNHGKIAIASQVSKAGFKSIEFINQNRETMSHMTGIDICNKRIDLICVDVASMLSKNDIANIYQHFCNRVELFLFLE